MECPKNTSQCMFQFWWMILENQSHVGNHTRLVSSSFQNCLTYFIRILTRILIKARAARYVHLLTNRQLFNHTARSCGRTFAATLLMLERLYMHQVTYHNFSSLRLCLSGLLFAGSVAGCLNMKKLCILEWSRLNWTDGMLRKRKLVEDMTRKLLVRGDYYLSLIITENHMFGGQSCLMFRY